MNCIPNIHMAMTSGPSYEFTRNAWQKVYYNSFFLKTFCELRPQTSYKRLKYYTSSYVYNRGQVAFTNRRGPKRNR